MSQQQKGDARAAEAEWLWPALCIAGLWLFGLFLSFIWLLTGLGAVVAALTVLVMLVLGKRRSLIADAWAGGAFLAAASALVWLFFLFFFRLY
jgi:hypothetical protein